MSGLILLRELWPHMAAISGFDPLCRALEAARPGECRSVRVGGTEGSAPGRLPGVAGRLYRGLAARIRIARPPLVSPSPFFGWPQEKAGRRVLSLASEERAAEIILCSGENQLGGSLMGASPSIRRRMSVCIHQPPSWFRLHWKDFRSLENLRSIICLSQGQAKFLSGLLATPVLTIRHGVCHRHFTPGSARGEGPVRLLFVGQWLRDFETLADAMQLIWAERPDVGLDCVVPRSARDHPAVFRLARSERCRWYEGITADELRDLYQGADLLFLPLIDSGANNAIVEAMASGLPVIASDAGGVREYVPEGCGGLCVPGDPLSHARAALDWLSDRGRRERASLLCRRFAEGDLDWGVIAQSLLAKLNGVGAFRAPVR